MSDPYALLRRLMVERQLKSRGIRDPQVLQLMMDVERHRFIPPDERHAAYEDHPISIGEGQTISQPYMVALMTELLQVGPEHRVLEVGTGSGYQTAVLARLAEEVISIERVAPLAATARETLDDMGLVNVRIMVGDGSLGWSEKAPYDRIIVTAAAPGVPLALQEQLAEGGRLVIPTGGVDMQELILIEKRDGRLIKRGHGGCRFVKLIGEQGWTDS